MPLRVLLVDDLPERAASVAEALARSGHVVIGRLLAGSDLRAEVLSLKPDLVVIDVDSPDRDVLEGMHALHREVPRPVVMFTRNDDRELIRQAVKAGVSAYVVGDLAAERVLPIMNVAMARFEQFQQLENDLADARSQLADRKLIEKAKGLLMQNRQLNEEAAYAAMRKMAMDRNIRMVELARAMLAAADLMG